MKGVFERPEGGQVGIDTKKSAARAKPEARATAGKPVAVKRPEAPAAAAKKRMRSVPPPAPVAANDNDRAHQRKDGLALKAAPPAGVPRGRLPTGSLHTEAREPPHAESLKQRLTALMAVQQKLGELKRASHKHFFEIGGLLKRVRDEKLFEARGYGSFESFLEREVPLGQQFCVNAIRIAEIFQPQAAASLGLARLTAALRAIEEEESGVTATDALRAARSPIPPHKL